MVTFSLTTETTEAKTVVFAAGELGPRDIIRLTSVGEVIAGDPLTSIAAGVASEDATYGYLFQNLGDLFAPPGDGLIQGDGAGTQSYRTLQASASGMAVAQGTGVGVNQTGAWTLYLTAINFASSNISVQVAVEVLKQP